MTILLENEENASFGFPIQEQLELLTEYVLDHEKFPYEAEVSVSIVSKEEIHEINKKFRQVDRPTDVLSFPMLEFEYPGDFSSETFENSLTTSFESQELLLGDIVLCTDIIKSQAKEYGHSEKREFSFSGSTQSSSSFLVMTTWKRRRECRWKNISVRSCRD